MLNRGLQIDLDELVKVLEAAFVERQEINSPKLIQPIRVIVAQYLYHSFSCLLFFFAETYLYHLHYFSLIVPKKKSAFQYSLSHK